MFVLLSPSSHLPCLGVRSVNPYVWWRRTDLRLRLKLENWKFPRLKFETWGAQGQPASFTGFMSLEHGHGQHLSTLSASSILQVTICGTGVQQYSSYIWYTKPKLPIYSLVAPFACISCLPRFALLA